MSYWQSPHARRRLIVRRGVTVALLVLGLTVAPAEVATAGGRQLWAARYDGPAHDRDLAVAVVVSADGSKTFSTGGSLGTNSGYDYVTAAYDSASGAQLWGERFGGAGSGDDFASSIAASPAGSAVFVTGDSVGTNGQSDYATVAYDAATGHQLWVSRYDGPSHSYDSAFSVGLSPDGSRVFVTGGSIGSAGTDDVATVAYDAATGGQLWVSRYDGPANDVDLAQAMAVSPGGSRVFVTGRSEAPTSGEDYLTIAYDSSTGAQLWVEKYNGTGNDSDLALAMGVSPGGSKVFITGWSIGATNDWDYATVAYSASSGHRVWVRRYDGPGHGSDQASSLAVSPGGSRVFVTGDSEGLNTTGFDYGTVAYAAGEGRQLWVSRYDGPDHADDIGISVAVSPGGRKVFVTGASYGINTSDDWATVAYAGSDGGRLWVNRYNGPSSDVDVAVSVAASPDGTKVFVCGFTRDPLTDDDFATAAYSA